jgi:hypothetical protein
MSNKSQIVPIFATSNGTDTISPPNDGAKKMYEMSKKTQIVTTFALSNGTETHHSG